MKLIVQVKLLITPEQAQALQHTLEMANAACDPIRERAWQAGTLRQCVLHQLVYHEVRQAFPLSAQMVLRQIAKVAQAYTLDRETRRVLRAQGSIASDARILSWRTCGRLRIPFVCGAGQRARLEKQAGEADQVGGGDGDTAGCRRGVGQAVGPGATARGRRHSRAVIL